MSNGVEYQYDIKILVAFYDGSKFSNQRLDTDLDVYALEFFRLVFKFKSFQVFNFHDYSIMFGFELSPRVEVSDFFFIEWIPYENFYDR